MILTAITFLIILTVLVLVHELGHFLVARLIGVRVEEFGLGLPPRAWGKKIGKTIYSLNWLPIGGFVRLAGEDDEEGHQARGKGIAIKEYFWARSKKERSAILIAGVVMNFLLAFVITVGLLVSGVKEPTNRVHVERVEAGSPAEQAGLLNNDVILSVAFSPNPPSPISTPNDLIQFVNAHKGEEVVLIVEREGQVSSVRAIPRIQVSEGKGPLGVAISEFELRKYSWREAPGKALTINIIRARDMFVSLGTMLWSLVRMQLPKVEVAGPIGIAQVTAQAITFGWKAVFEIASIISLNLAVLNILPIPALDGGRLVFVFLEKALGKKIRPAFEKSTHQIGMIILLGIILLVSIQDILRLVRGG